MWVHRQQVQHAHVSKRPIISSYIFLTSSQYLVRAASDRSLIARSSLYLAISFRCMSDSCTFASAVVWQCGVVRKESSFKMGTGETWGQKKATLSSTVGQRNRVERTSRRKATRCARCAFPCFNALMFNSYIQKKKRAVNRCGW